MDHDDEVVAVRSSALSGLGLFATAAFSKDDVIFTETPIASVLHADITSDCTGPWRMTEMLLEEGAPAVARAAFLLDSGLAPAPESVLAWDAVDQAHLVRLHGQGGHGLDLESVRRLYAIVVSVNVAYKGPLGVCICRNMSFVNHSCAFNCDMDFGQDGSCSLRATRDIAVGEELTMHYLQPLVLEMRRRGMAKHASRAVKQELKRLFGLDCGCDICCGGKKKEGSSHSS